MTKDEKRQALEMFIGSTNVAAVYEEVMGDLEEALHSASELRLWPDAVDSVSTEQAFICWKLIEQLKERKFPDYLKM